MASVPQRAIALAPHIVELMAAAGATGALVGRVSSANYPPSVNALPSIGDGRSLNAEALLALRPDILLAWHPEPVRPLEPVLRAQGVAVAYSDPTRLDDIAAQVETLGARFGTQAIADPAAARLRQTLADLRARHAETAPIRVFMQLGTGPVYSLGGQSIINDVLHACGAQNVMAASPIAAPLMSAEGMLAARPDAVLVGGDADEAQAVQAWWYAHGWRRADGLAPGHPDPRIIALPADVLLRPTPRLIDALPTLCARIDAARPARHRPETPAP